LLFLIDLSILFKRVLIAHNFSRSKGRETTLPRLNWLILLLGVIFVHCASNKTFTEVEKAKLDPSLVRLLNGEQMDESNFDVQQLTDGTKLYAIIVRSLDAEEIKKMGVIVSSIFGDVIVARATLQQIRLLASLPSLTSIQTSMTNFPQSKH
jgi:hypothetical protein